MAAETWVLNPGATHEITMTRQPYFSTEYVYRATCSCGRYRGGKHASPGYAEGAAMDHVNAKTGGR